MKRLAILFFFSFLLLSDHAFAAEIIIRSDTAIDENTRIEILKEEALQLFDSTQKPKVIARGFTWVEGPLYVADGDYLLFSEIPKNRVCKWTRNGDTSEYLLPSGFTGETTYRGREPGSNALLLNSRKQLILLQHGDRRISLMNASLQHPEPQFVSLVNNYRNKRLNSPNDGVFDANGNLYFTDPAYGLANGLADTAKDLPFQGVFVLRPNGKLDLFTGEVKFPNGIALSPDNHYLFISNSDPENKTWLRFEIGADGGKKSGSLWYHLSAEDGKDNGNPDGMKMSPNGYLFASGPQGIYVFNPNAELIARIYTGRLTSNCAFGKNNKELFITCGSEIMRLNLK